MLSNAHHHSIGFDKRLGPSIQLKRSFEKVGKITARGERNVVKTRGALQRQHGIEEGPQTK